MRQRIKVVLLGCAAAALAAAVAPASATVYNVNRTIDGGSVVGTITTDGATGVINPSDFIAWDLVFSGPGSTVTITAMICSMPSMAKAWTSPPTQRMSPSTSPLATAAFSSFSRS